MKIDPGHMAEAADQASELLRSLGNRHRLLMLCQLTEGERSVGDLAAFLKLRDSTVSQHLSLLRRDGQTIWYRIASPPARRVLETLFEIFCKPVSMCEPSARQRKADAPPRVGRKR